MKKFCFTFDPKKCSACGACAIACMDQNDIAITEGQQPYRKIYRGDGDGGSVYLSISCLHCADAQCVTACPVGCLKKDPETGLTLYDNTNCIGCHSCAMACPYGAPSFRMVSENPRREKMEKCDGCRLRVEAGKKPACIHACPTDALSWKWADANEEDSLANLYRSWQAVSTEN